MAIIENNIEEYLKKQAENNGMLCYKFTSPGTNGVPDRILIYKGQVIFVELKAPGQKPRKLQKVVIQEMRKHGAIVKIIDSYELVDQLILDIKKE